MSQSKIVSGEEALASYEKTQERLAEQVYIVDDHVVINVKYEYNIHLSRCDSIPKILSWVKHLCEKTWMTNEVMRRFIVVAAGHHKLDIPNP